MTVDLNANANVAICHRCDRSQSRAKGGCNGVCLCRENNQDIVDNARAGKCPLNLFPVLTAEERGRLSLAAAIARAPMPIPGDFDPRVEQRRMIAGGCCGSPSKVSDQNE